MHWFGNAANLECGYINYNLDDYCCRIMNGRVKAKEAVSISGNHLLNKNDYDVKYVEFVSTEMLEQIPNLIFRQFPNLQKVIVSTSSLKYLNQTSLRGATKMKQLMAKGNYVQRLEADSFTEALNLNLIDLQDNWISFVDKGAFRKLTNLEILRLGGNFITSLDRNTFVDLKSLKKIDLSSNMIQSLKEGLFSNNVLLEEAHICCNKITNIATNLFSQTKSLSFLNLAHNTCTSKTFGPKNRPMVGLQGEINKCSPENSPDMQIRRLKKELQNSQRDVSNLEQKKITLDAHFLRQSEENVRLKQNMTRVIRDLIGARKNISELLETINQNNKNSDSNQTLDCEDLQISSERCESDLSALRHVKNQGDAVYQQCEVNKSECQENALKISTNWQQSQSTATELLLENDKLNDKLRSCQEAKTACQNQKNIIRTG